VIKINGFSDEKINKHFIVGESNNDAYKLVSDALKSPSCIHNPLVVCGSTGVGKTHLVRSVIQAETNAKAAYISAEELINDLLSILKHNKRDKDNFIDLKPFFSDKFNAYNDIVIDNIHILLWKDATQGCVFEIIDNLICEDKQIIMISDTPLDEYSVLQKHMCINFEKLMVCKVDRPDTTLKQKIVAKYGEQYGVKLDAAALTWLTDNIDSTPYIIGTIKKLAMAADNKEKVSLLTIKKVLKEIRHENR